MKTCEWNYKVSQVLVIHNVTRMSVLDRGWQLCVCVVGERETERERKREREREREKINKERYRYR